MVDFFLGFGFFIRTNFWRCIQAVSKKGFKREQVYLAEIRKGRPRQMAESVHGVPVIRQPFYLIQGILQTLSRKSVYI